MPSEKIYPIRKSVTFNLPGGRKHTKDTHDLNASEVALKMFWKSPPIPIDAVKVIDEINKEVAEDMELKPNCCVVM